MITQGTNTEARRRSHGFCFDWTLRHGGTEAELWLWFWLIFWLGVTAGAVERRSYGQVHSRSLCTNGDSGNIPGFWFLFWLIFWLITAIPLLSGFARLGVWWGGERRLFVECHRRGSGRSNRFSNGYSHRRIYLWRPFRCHIWGREWGRGQ